MNSPISDWKISVLKQSEKELSTTGSSTTPNPQKIFAFKIKLNPAFCIVATLNWL
jgi:hypothetical protein